MSYEEETHNNYRRRTHTESQKIRLFEGESLSTLVERTLREAAVKYEPTLSSRWRGRFKPTEGDDPRYEALAQKYLK